MISPNQWNLQNMQKKEVLKRFGRLKADSTSFPIAANGYQWPNRLGQFRVRCPPAMARVGRAASRWRGRVAALLVLALEALVPAAAPLVLAWEALVPAAEAIPSLRAAGWRSGAVQTHSNESPSHRRVPCTS